MLSLGRFLQHAAGEGEPDYDALVERLVRRVAEAVLLPDRRAALQELRDLLAGGAGGDKAQMAFGAVGLPVALGVARDREDLEMVQLALECLAVAVGGGEHAQGHGGGGVSQAAAINAQQLARAPEGLPLLLSLLEAEPAGVADFYARYHALQVLKGLSLAAPLQLQEAILGAPLGVTRLMDLLGEQEVLRNEALLLLTRLAGGSPDLQKIAVFEGAFDRLFGIIREEGGMEGDIVVQDCLQLLAALLRGSPPNQLMFRETGWLAQLPSMLRLPDEASPAGRAGSRVALALPSSPGARRELAPQAAANLTAALEVVLALLPPAAAPPAAPVCASAAESRQALLQRGLVEALLPLALQGGGVGDEAVRAQALLCLAAAVGGNRLQQDRLAALAVKSPVGEQQPLLAAALAHALDGAGPAEQTAADRLLEAYCLGNAAGQAALAGPLLHAGGAAAPGTWAGLLLAGLGRQGSLGELSAAARAAAALGHLLPGSQGLQLQLLGVSVPLPAGPGAPGFSAGSCSLMALCVGGLAALVTQQYGRQPGSVAAAADLLRLLLPWLHGCPAAVTALLRAVAQSQPFLVDSLRGSNACSGAASSAHPLTRGMLALLLGLCACYAEDGAGTPTQPQLLGAIGQQVGQAQYLAALDAMLQHPAVAAALAGASSSGSGSVFGEPPLPSPAFAAFLRGLAAEVRQRLTGEPAPPLPLLSAPTAAAAATAAAPVAPAVPLLPATGAAPVATAAQQLPHPPVFQPLAPHAALHPPPPPPLPAASPAAALPNGRAPWSGSSSPRGQPQQQASLASRGSAAPSPQPPSPRLQPPLPPPPAGVPMFASAGAAAAVLGSPRFSPSPPAGSPRAGDARLQQVLAQVERLQRENQQLRSEATALRERLRLGAASGAADGLAVQAAQAEAEAARQQLAAAQQQLAEVEAAAERSRGDAQAAQAAARKLETDLEDLSAAYGNLDAHAGSLQQQVDQLQAQLEQQRAAAAAAIADNGAAAPAGGGSGGSNGGVSEAEVAQRVAAARAEGAAEAQTEADEAMTDLLVCLGQEEAKVARLRERLEGLGVDVDALVADIVAAGEAPLADHDDDDLT